MIKKPKCKLIGVNGNIFNLYAIARKALLKNNCDNKVPEMEKRVFSSNSYDEALMVISEYVEIE